MVVRSENFQSPSVSGGAGFERLPWFDSPMRVGGIAGLVGGIDCSIIILKTETPTAAIVEKTCSFKNKGISSSASSRKMSSGT